MKKVEMQISQLEYRVLGLMGIIKDGTLGMVVLSGEPIPDVDIFLTEEEFIENANQDLQETDFTITKELYQVLFCFGFLPSAGFLSNKVKLVPYKKTMRETVDDKDDSFLKLILDRKRAMYDAQYEGLLSCKDDLEYIGVRNFSTAFTDDVNQY